jgi:predicted aconitase with swiveling domain
MGRLIQGTVVVAGIGHGEAIVTDEPLSFWGGYDHQSGEITDRRHPLSGENAAAKILVVPFSRGSSTTTAVLLEAIREHTAPLAILTTSVDTFFALASIVADEMYSRPIPILVIEPEEAAYIASGDELQIEIDGTIRILQTVNQ